MFNRNSPRRPGVAWPAALSALLLAALAVAADNPPSPLNPLEAASASRVPSAQRSYQVRCWQYGRLLFEESDLQLPEVPGGLKLHGTDQNKQPVYITDTGSSICLVRSVQGRR
jgi:hypothetical protein